MSFSDDRDGDYKIESEPESEDLSSSESEDQSEEILQMSSVLKGEKNHSKIKTTFKFDQLDNENPFSFNEPHEGKNIEDAELETPKLDAGS